MSIASPSGKLVFASAPGEFEASRSQGLQPAPVVRNVTGPGADDLRVGPGEALSGLVERIEVTGRSLFVVSADETPSRHEAVVDRKSGRLFLQYQDAPAGIVGRDRGNSPRSPHADHDNVCL